MRQYGLSKQKLFGIIHRPERKEKGIAPGTTAVMKTNKTFFRAKQTTLFKAWSYPRKAPGEIWLMYKDAKDFRKKYSAQAQQKRSPLRPCAMLRASFNENLYNSPSASVSATAPMLNYPLGAPFADPTIFPGVTPAHTA